MNYLVDRLSSLYRVKFTCRRMGLALSGPSNAERHEIASYWQELTGMFQKDVPALLIRRLVRHFIQAKE